MLNVKHLRLIRDALDRFPTNRLFNIEHWTNRIEWTDSLDDIAKAMMIDANADRISSDQVPVVANECGTVCCAIGWAMNDPVVNAAGLISDADNVPLYNDYRGWSAVIRFMSQDPTSLLPNGEVGAICHSLFAVAGYDYAHDVTLSDVIAKIDKTLADVGA